MQTLSLTGKKEKKEGYSWKILLFGLFGIVFAFVFGLSLAKVFASQKILGISSFWFLLISLFLFLINFSLESIFSEKSRWFFNLLQGLAIGIGFYLSWANFFLGWLPIVGLIPGIFLFWGHSSIRKREEDMMKLRWNRMVKTGLATMLTGLILFASVSYGIFLMNRQDAKIFVSEAGIEKFLTPSNFVGKIFFKNFSWQTTFDDFLITASEKTLGSVLDKFTNNSFLSKMPIDFSSMAQEQKNQFIQENLPQWKNSVAKFLKIEIQGNEKLYQIAYKWLFNLLEGLPKLAQRGFFAAIAVIMFLVLKAIAPIISLVARLISWLVYELLLATGFAEIAYETKSKENAVFS